MTNRAVSGGALKTTSARPQSRLRSRLFARLLAFAEKLGPGIVTGAADDDPSGIATYSQVGAQFGFSMLWTMLLTYPLMAAIQEISAWIARVTGAGLAANIRRHYSSTILYPIVGLLLVANVINIGADIGAMGSAAQLILGGFAWLYAIFFGLISTISVVAMPYKSYARVLKWSTIVLFVYVATALMVHAPLKHILSGTFLPSLTFSNDYLTALTAVFGTTISPYLLFWQASAEVQEQQAAPREKPLKQAPHQAKAQLQPMHADTYMGMAFSNAIAFFIILDTAAVLHAGGVTDIQTSAQAAEALRPLSGELAFLLFSIGIVGTGLIAIPVLAGSSAYALGETLKWRVGLEHKLQRAMGFYGILSAATLIGVGLNFIGLNPIKALFWSAVINGLAAVPIMILMMVMSSNRKITGALRLPFPQKVIGWIATAIMFIVAAGMLATFAREIPVR
jgi:NRAMP (natural resistance-associated macrophage protein)-like metal ion transporter